MILDRTNSIIVLDPATEEQLGRWRPTPDGLRSAVNFARRNGIGRIYRVELEMRQGKETEVLFGWVLDPVGDQEPANFPG